MARAVSWTERAWSDLDQAADYIARDSPNYAATLLAQARDTGRTLDRFAEQGRVVPELSDPAIREIFVGSFRLVYRVLSTRVEVLTFVHGARDLTELWRREPPDEG
ncbi:MAG: type II toxin-antitoxin system RelE/ParE family toxin [Thermoanaerobaculia bacterium]